MIRRLSGCAVLGLALACAPCRADLLHLKGGGVIDADHWWIEGETLHVESAGGSVGLPRNLLVRVESAERQAKARSAASPS